MYDIKDCTLSQLVNRPDAELAQIIRNAIIGYAEVTEAGVFKGTVLHLQQVKGASMTIAIKLDE